MTVLRTNLMWSILEFCNIRGLEDIRYKLGNCFFVSCCNIGTKWVSVGDMPQIIFELI